MVIMTKVSPSFLKVSVFFSRFRFYTAVKDYGTIEFGRRSDAFRPVKKGACKWYFLLEHIL